jgi:hypothetical protein
VGIRRSIRLTITAILVGGIVCGAASAASAVQALILTNVGQVAEGNLTGIAQVIRLLATDGVTSVGPGSQFDVALTSIRQITLDFPRIVIDSEDRTLIGPYSSFGGIPQAVQLDRPGEPSVTIPMSSLRAIALNGHSLRPVPRVWLGDGHLSAPEISAATAFVASECADCTINLPRAGQDPDLTPIWNGLSPEYVVPEEPAELPWWVGLLGVAALVVVAYLLTAAAAPSS